MIVLDALGVHYLACVVVSATVLWPIGYGLLSRYAFRCAPRWRAFLRYGLAMFLNLPAGIVSVFILYDAMALPMALAAPLATVAMMIWNYAASYWALLGARTSRRAMAA